MSFTDSNHFSMSLSLSYWNITVEHFGKLEAIQRWSAICRIIACDLELWPITNSFCAFLVRVISYPRTKN